MNLVKILTDLQRKEKRLQQNLRSTREHIEIIEKELKQKGDTTTGVT